MAHRRLPSASRYTAPTRGGRPGYRLAFALPPTSRDGQAAALRRQIAAGTIRPKRPPPVCAVDPVAWALAEANYLPKLLEWLWAYSADTWEIWCARHGSVPDPELARDAIHAAGGTRRGEGAYYHDQDLWDAADPPRVRLERRLYRCPRRAMREWLSSRRLGEKRREWHTSQEVEHTAGFLSGIDPSLWATLAAALQAAEYRPLTPEEQDLLATTRAMNQTVSEVGNGRVKLRDVQKNYNDHYARERARSAAEAIAAARAQTTLPLPLPLDTTGIHDPATGGPDADG